MLQQRFNSQHDDYVHDVAYDFYGKRMATVSSDQKIRVWDLDGTGTEESTNWKCTAEWKAHTGSIWKIQWAHPEFGQILASCSFDRTVEIYEEQGQTQAAKGSTWVKKAALVDFRMSVQDIKFSPAQHGLKLACACADGTVKTYEAIDIMNLTHWPLLEDFEAHKEGVNCLAWNPCKFESPMFVTGGMKEDSTTGRAPVKVWSYSDNTRRWQEAHVLDEHTQSVLDVAWAPNMGRRYHLIATASKDKSVIIWKIPLIGRGDSPVKLAKLTAHNAEVWKVEWNVTGTILASSGDDGVVRLWKCNLEDGQWYQVKDISSEM